MRKVILISMISLDGVMQAPGGPKEDKSGGFKYGGWLAPFFDQVYAKAAEDQMKPADLLLGRKTFDIFEGFWPKHEDEWPGVSEVAKYVVSRTRRKSNWKNTVFLKGVADIKRLKNSNGGDIKVWGSAGLAQSLLKHDLVDELWLRIHPLTLGKGKKLFNEGPIPATFKLTESVVTPSGVLIANYRRAGEVKTGTMGE